MKIAIISALITLAASHPAIIPAAVHTGHSAQFRSQDNVGNYAFGYNEDHATGGSFRRESGNALGQVVGSYGLRDIDGRIRTVNYVADDLGFRAAIQTNEPGVEPKDPAATLINKPGLAPIVAEPAVHAPLALAAPLHHPIAHHPVAHAHAAPLLAHGHGHLLAAPAVHHGHHAALVAPAPLHVDAHHGHHATLLAAPAAHAYTHHAFAHHPHAGHLLAAPAVHHASYAHAPLLSSLGHYY